METPIEQLGDYWVKREDSFEVAGVNGGKVRTCWQLSQGATEAIGEVQFGAIETDPIDEQIM